MKTANELIQNPKNYKPHVVLLGAGASRAAFPNGDANNKLLPLMSDLVDYLDLTSLLQSANINPKDNFETIYSNLSDSGLRQEIETRIYDYFSTLILPDTINIYDRLLLSLRDKDAIFTFNWDPFLFDAYKRNCGVASLPTIFFLHGNVRVGCCKKHNHRFGDKGIICPECQIPFSKIPLLYPVEQKNYSSSDPYIASGWESAKKYFASAFTISVFGYSAPISDVDAIALIRTAWFNESEREFEKIEIIDIENRDTLSKRWNSFSPTCHNKYITSFEESILWKYPRRSCEAMLYPMMQGLPCEAFPLVKHDSLIELQQYIEKIATYEIV